MKILIVSATNAEIQLLTNHFNSTQHLNLLVSGVGMVATAFALGNHLARQKDYDLIINAGIAGAFDRNIAIGEVVIIKADTFSELGAEDNDHFLTIDDLGHGKSTFHPSIEHVAFSKLRQVDAITVNRVHGRAISIKQIMQRLDPQLESMEGAAFFYACSKYNIPCIQVRAVSNYIEKRNRANWQIGLAVKNLNETLIEILDKLRNSVNIQNAEDI
ncbi:MAG: futalosine hydrolase [Sphingobacteriaceae bacterium]